MHEKETKNQIPPEFGYPDHGSGRFADKLPYKDWFKFECGQRAQKNFLEHYSFICVLIAIAGTTYPLFTLISSAFCAAGRVVYGLGYISKGPSGRNIGSRLYAVGLWTLKGMSVHSLYLVLA